jgi:hypothetical protein
VDWEIKHVSQCTWLLIMYSLYMLHEKNMYKFRKNTKAMMLKNNFALTCFNLLNTDLGTMDERCTRYCSWFRHCATSRKVAASIPGGVIGILRWHNPSGHTMTLGLTQPLTDVRTRNISWGVKAASVYGWQPYHLHVLTILKSGSLNLLEPHGPVQACNGIVFTTNNRDENVKL